MKADLPPDPTETTADDVLLPVTPPEVVAILGFDPLEFETEEPPTPKPAE